MEFEFLKLECASGGSGRARATEVYKEVALCGQKRLKALTSLFKTHFKNFEKPQMANQVKTSENYGKSKKIDS